MHANGLHHYGIAPSAASAAAVSALFANECGFDTPGVSIPRAEPHLVVRFGPSARRGLDLHAIGPRRHANRKTIRSGQRTVTARLRLGMHEAVLGVPPTELADRVVPLAELWGDAASARLHARLAETRDLAGAATVVQLAISERLAGAGSTRVRASLVLDAAARLGAASVRAVADDLGTSERNLRRVFRESVGMSPKAFARLTRFQRALHEARSSLRVDWADIAVASGYYDQAHLIADFREIAGVTPRVLLAELRSAVPRRQHVVGERPRD